MSVLPQSPYWNELIRTLDPFKLKTTWVMILLIFIWEHICSISIVCGRVGLYRICNWWDCLMRTLPLKWILLYLLVHVINIVSPFDSGCDAHTSYRTTTVIAPMSRTRNDTGPLLTYSAPWCQLTSTINSTISTPWR